MANLFERGEFYDFNDVSEILTESGKNALVIDIARRAGYTLITELKETDQVSLLNEDTTIRSEIDYTSLVDRGLFPKKVESTEKDLIDAYGQGIIEGLEDLDNVLHHARELQVVCDVEENGFLVEYTVTSEVTT